MSARLILDRFEIYQISVARIRANSTLNSRLRFYVTGYVVSKIAKICDKYIRICGYLCSNICVFCLETDIDEELLKSRIYTIRELKVMPDVDLAEI